MMFRLFHAADKNAGGPSSPLSAAEEADFDALLEDYLPGKARRPRGEAFEAVVAAVLDDTVLVSYGAKEEGAIPKREFTDARGVCRVKPGDRVSVVSMGRKPDGEEELSHRQARVAEAEKALEQAHAKALPVRGIVDSVVKGGLTVDLGMRAFMPASHADLYRIADLSTLIGQEVEVLIIDFDRAKRRVVVSRRDLLKQRRDAAVAEFIRTIRPGQTVTATVREILNFGAFVRIGPVDALLPRSEMSWDLNVNPAEVVQPGQEIEVSIIDLNPETGKVTVSRRRLNADPWASAPERYKPGTVVQGRVDKVEAFGAFVQLEEGISGLIHASNMSWESGQTNPSHHVRVGDTVTCQVLEVDAARKRVALGLKQLMRDPWTTIAERYPLKSIHRGTVASLMPFGAIVRLADGTEGMLHVSELTYEKRIAHPSEMLAEGQEVEVAIIKIDNEKRRLGLSMRATAPSPIEAFAKAHPVGSIVTGRVVGFAPFGAMVELAPNLQGMIHISEIDEQRVESAERVLKLGEEVTVKVLNIEPKKGRIGLSRRAALKQAERDNIREYTQQGRTEKVGLSLGDLLKNAIKK